MEGANKGTELVIIPMAQYVELLDTRTKYGILEEHIRQMIAKNENGANYSNANYCDGLFKAVVGYKEGVRDAEKADA